MGLNDDVGPMIVRREGQNPIRNSENFERKGRTKRTKRTGIIRGFVRSTGNVIEIRSPRCFDPADAQVANMRTLFSYTERGLQSSQTVAAGAGSAQAITSQTYTLDGKTATRTDAGGNVWTSEYDDACCGQFAGQMDPLGHGSLSNSDSAGRTVHSAVVSQFDLAIGGSSSNLDPADGKTLGESTTRCKIPGDLV